MIKLLIFSLLFLWQAVDCQANPYILGAAQQSSGGCSSTPYYSNTTTDFQNKYFANVIDTELSGGRSNFGTDITNVCAVDVYMGGVGDVDAIDWVLTRWSGGTATTMGTEQDVSATIDGTEMPANGVYAWVHFTFSTPITIADDNVLLVRRTDSSFSGTNYLVKSFDYDSGDASFFWIVHSMADGSTYYEEGTSHAMNIKIYRTE